MDTNEELVAAVDAMTGEIHDLSGRLSAKEILAEKTLAITKTNRRNTLLVAGAVGVAIIALLLVYSVVRSNTDTGAYWSGCLGDWGKKSSERSDIIGSASELRDEKKGESDRALRVLVDYRGDPTNAAIEQAKADYAKADDEAVKAEVKLQTLRGLYPPPQIEDFCTRMKVDKTDPKAGGQ